MVKFSIFLFLAIQLCFGVFGCNRHPGLGLSNLNVERYLGKWNLIAYADSIENDDRRCVSESYASNALGNPHLLDTYWSGIVGEQPMTQQGLIVINSNMKSNWNFYLDKTVFRSIILATNYDDWTLEYTCEPDMDFERIMLRSRNHTIQPDVLKTLISVAQGYGFEEKDMKFIDQSNC